MSAIGKGIRRANARTARNQEFRPVRANEWMSDNVHYVISTIFEPTPSGCQTSLFGALTPAGLRNGRLMRALEPRYNPDRSETQPQVKIHRQPQVQDHTWPRIRLLRMIVTKRFDAEQRF